MPGVKTAAPSGEEEEEEEEEEEDEAALSEAAGVCVWDDVPELLFPQAASSVVKEIARQAMAARYRFFTMKHLPLIFQFD